MDLTASTNRHRQVTGPQPMDPMGHTPVQPVFVPAMHGGPGMPLQPMPSGMTPMGPNSGGYHFPGTMNPTGPHLPPGYSVQPGMVPGGYGSMTGGQVGAPPEPGGVADYVQRYRELSAPKRILVILAPFCLIATAYLLFFDSPQPRGPMASADAGIEASAAHAAATPPPATLAPPPTLVVSPGQPLPGQPPPGQPPPPPGQPPPGQPPPGQPPPGQPPAPNPCPTGYVPYSVPLPNGAIPCVPVGTPMPGVPTPPPLQTLTPTPPPPPTGTPAAPRDAGPPVAEVSPSTRTLERQAVDYVAMNDYIRAAQVYEQLQAQNPSNRVYAEAARILRAKADAGAPP